MGEKLLAIDDRYLIINGEQVRVAVSWGHNPRKAASDEQPAPALPEGYTLGPEGDTIMDSKGRTIIIAPFDILAPARREGDMVFGLHNVITDGERVRIVDMWLDVLEAKGVATEAEAAEKAPSILFSISDQEYRNMCRFNGVVGELARLPVHRWTLYK